MENDKRENSIVKSLIWMTMSTGVLAIFKLLVTAVLSRNMDSIEFGIVSGLHVISNFTVVFAQMGVASAIIQEKQISKEDVTTAYTVTVITGVICGLILFLGSRPLAFLIGIQELDLLIKVYAIVFLFNGLSSIGTALIEKNMQFKKLTIINMASYIVGHLIISLVLAYYGYGAWAIVIGEVVATFVKLCIIFIVQPFSKRLRIYKESFVKMRKSSSGFAIARLLGYLGANIDYFLVGRILGTSTLGLYNRTFQVISLPTNTIGEVVQKVYFPGVSKIQEKKKELKYLYKKTLFSLSLFLLPSYVIVVLLAPELVTLILGSEWTGIIFPLQIMAICMYTKTIGKLNMAYLKSYNKIKYRVISQTTTAVTVGLGTLIGSYWGLNGVAVGVTISLIVNSVILMVMVMTMIGATMRDVIDCIEVPLFMTIIYLGCIGCVSYVFRTILTVNYIMVLVVCVFATIVITLVAILVYVRVVKRTTIKLFIELVLFSLGFKTLSVKEEVKW